MNRILGIDLGVASIGWALTAESNDEKTILDMGCRIIPLNTDDKDEFSAGNTISKNQNRTVKRTIRKGYDRYQLRRSNLTALLLQHNMYDADLNRLTATELFGLRSKAAAEKVSAQELGRILYHLNQKRGYKSSRKDINLDKKDTDYVAEVKSRHQHIKDTGQTIGQYFYSQLTTNPYYRIKKQVFPREAYQEEFDAIMAEQARHHNFLNPELIVQLRNEVIYYQRPLKSQKGLVSICEFEGYYDKDVKGKTLFIGPRVAPKSSPIFQVCRLWETINNITIKNKTGADYVLSIEEKQRIFSFLDNNKTLSQAELWRLLKLPKDEGWYSNKQIAKGLQGNVTKAMLLEKLKDYAAKDELLRFNLAISDTGETVYLADRKDGSVKAETKGKVITAAYEQEPLYKLWHTVYSIADADDCRRTLVKNFGLPEATAAALATLDFTKFSFGNKSARAIRKILPYLQEGWRYSEACSFAGYNHSDSYTKEEQLKRTLLPQMPLLAKNSLRQPIVEKILNQLIHVVNSIISKHGTPSEIRIELARELKQSREERNETFANLSKIERENKIIADRIEELGLKATRKRIIKYRLFQEISGEESKLNGACVYCGKAFSLTQALGGAEVDVEHIIPKAKLFDDSQGNKTLSHRACNAAKGDRTAFDYMHSLGDAAFDGYIERVVNLYKNNLIKKGKRDKLLMPEAKIPRDFIERQLRETQYIARKAKELLEQVCHNVWSTSGKVTSLLRRCWGWDDVLMQLQLPMYRQMGLTEWKEWEAADGAIQKEEVIKEWSKRDDHRHHALDALAIACTKQGFIQRMNTLSAAHTREEMYNEVKNQQFREKLTLLERYIITYRPFTPKQVQEKLAGILISFKPGKKVAVKGRNAPKGAEAQKGIIVPKGPLSEESVYGRIMGIEKQKSIKYIFENPQLIFKPRIKEMVLQRLEAYGQDAKKALASLKKEPLYADNEKTIPLTYATCYKEEYVIKYPLASLKAKDAEYIIDGRVKEIVKERLAMYGNKEKEAFKDLENNPVWYNEEKQIPILSVRCFTGLSAVEAVKKDAAGRPIGFVKPGNNHHIAIYTDENGKKQENVCSFWHAVERKKYGLPVIITNPAQVWDKILAGRENYPEEFLTKLPPDSWQYSESLQQNEMFVLGLGRAALEELVANNDMATVSRHLYRVQKIATMNYVFRHHLETQLNDTEVAKSAKRYIMTRSFGAFDKLTPVKVLINHLGEIILQ